MESNIIGNKGAYLHRFGSLSNLPLNEGDDVYCMIGIIPYTEEKCNGIVTSNFIPITFPFLGKYNMQGYVDNIDKDSEGLVSDICRYFELKVEDFSTKLLKSITYLELGMNGSIPHYTDFINKIYPLTVDLNDETNWTLGLFIEDKAYFDCLTKNIPIDDSMNPLFILLDDDILTDYYGFKKEGEHDFKKDYVHIRNCGAYYYLVDDDTNDIIDDSCISTPAGLYKEVKKKYGKRLTSVDFKVNATYAYYLLKQVYKCVEILTEPIDEANKFKFLNDLISLIHGDSYYTEELLKNYTSVDNGVEFLGKNMDTYLKFNRLLNKTFYSSNLMFNRNHPIALVLDDYRNNKKIDSTRGLEKGLFLSNFVLSDLKNDVYPKYFNELSKYIQLLMLLDKLGWKLEASRFTDVDYKENLELLIHLKYYVLSVLKDIKIEEDCKDEGSF